MSTPIAAAHLLISQPLPNTDEWEAKIFPALRLDAVDHLSISPFVVSEDGRLALESEHVLGPRVVEVVNKAREEASAANHNVKIFAMQWWGKNSGGIFKLTSEELRKAYAASVPALLDKYGLDGYDIDYEWNEDGTAGNLVHWAPKLLHDIHQTLKDYGVKKGRKYYVAITPASPAFLHPTKVCGSWYKAVNQEAKDFPVNQSVDYVNVQTYAGGRLADGNSTSEWIGGVGFKSSQLLFGICSERGQRRTRFQWPTIPEAIAGYQNSGNKLAGIHLWRLNGNTAWSNKVQPVLYNWLHGKTLPHSISLEKAEEDWEKETA